MLYDLETVPLTKKQEAELVVAELKMLRFSLGVMRMDSKSGIYIYIYIYNTIGVYYPLLTNLAHNISIIVILDFIVVSLNKIISYTLLGIRHFYNENFYIVSLYIYIYIYIYNKYAK